MRISMCGLGIMGTNHLRVCKQSHDIVSLYDPIKYNDKDNYLRGLKSSDALIISSPTKFHIANIMEALEVNKNIKILCEKPLTDKTSDATIKQLEDFEDNILVGLVERFNPIVQKLKQIISSQDILQIKTRRVGNIPAREHIDSRLDIGIHDIDISCFLIGHTPDSIEILSNEQGGISSHENMFYEIGGIQVANETSWHYPFKDRSIEVLTEQGLYKGQYFDQTLEMTDSLCYTRTIEIARREPLAEQLIELEKMVTEQKPSSSTISHSVNLLKLMGY